MKIKVDEYLPTRLKPSLERLSHDVATTGEEQQLRQRDPIIAAAARAESRRLFTLDRDLADVRKYPPGSHPGIVLFRPATAGPGAVFRFVMGFVHAVDLDHFVGCLVIVDPGRIRVRRPR
jgi:predicted nuclease of predicted toxin-antitoxin system